MTRERSSSFRRNGSGGSKGSVTFDAGNLDDFSKSPPPLSLSTLNQSSSSRFNPSAISSTGSYPQLPSSHRPGHPSSSSTSTISSIPSAQPDAQLPSYNTFSAPANRSGYSLSPIVTRMRERDADAIAEYKKRNRRDSAGTSETRSSSGFMSSGLPFVNGSGAFPRNNFVGSTSVADRRLRSSVSAAQLRSSPPPAQFHGDPADQPTPRGRSGTNPSTIFQASPSTEFSRLNLSTSPTSKPRSISRPAMRRTGLDPTSEAEDYTGPSEHYAFFPPPPEQPIPRTHSNTGSLSNKSTTPTARRAAFATLLSRPSPSLDLPGGTNTQRAHRRGISTSELKG